MSTTQAHTQLQHRTPPELDNVIILTNEIIAELTQIRKYSTTMIFKQQSTTKPQSPQQTGTMLDTTKNFSFFSKIPEFSTIPLKLSQLFTALHSTIVAIPAIHYIFLHDLIDTLFFEHLLLYWSKVTIIRTIMIQIYTIIYQNNESRLPLLYIRLLSVITSPTNIRLLSKTINSNVLLFILEVITNLTTTYGVAFISSDISSLYCIIVYILYYNTYIDEKISKQIPSVYMTYIPDNYTTASTLTTNNPTQSTATQKHTNPSTHVTSHHYIYSLQQEHIAIIYHPVILQQSLGLLLQFVSNYELFTTLFLSPPMTTTTAPTTLQQPHTISASTTNLTSTSQISKTTPISSAQMATKTQNSINIEILLILFHNIASYNNITYILHQYDDILPENSTQISKTSIALSRKFETTHTLPYYDELLHYSVASLPRIITTTTQSNCGNMSSTNIRPRSPLINSPMSTYNTTDQDDPGDVLIHSQSRLQSPNADMGSPTNEFTSDTASSSLTQSSTTTTITVSPSITNHILSDLQYYLSQHRTGSIQITTNSIKSQYITHLSQLRTVLLTTILNFISFTHNNIANDNEMVLLLLIMSTDALMLIVDSNQQNEWIYQIAAIFAMLSGPPHPKITHDNWANFRCFTNSSCTTPPSPMIDSITDHYNTTEYPMLCGDFYHLLNYTFLTKLQSITFSSYGFMCKNVRFLFFKLITQYIIIIRMQMKSMAEFFDNLTKSQLVNDDCGDILEFYQLLSQEIVNAVEGVKVAPLTPTNADFARNFDSREESTDDSDNDVFMGPAGEDNSDDDDIFTIQERAKQQHNKQMKKLEKVNRPKKMEKTHQNTNTHISTTSGINYNTLGSKIISDLSHYDFYLQKLEQTQQAANSPTNPVQSTPSLSKPTAHNTYSDLTLNQLFDVLNIIYSYGYVLHDDYYSPLSLDFSQTLDVSPQPTIPPNTLSKYAPIPHSAASSGAVTATLSTQPTPLTLLQAFLPQTSAAMNENYSIVVSKQLMFVIKHALIDLNCEDTPKYNSFLKIVFSYNSLLMLRYNIHSIASNINNTFIQPDLSNPTNDTSQGNYINTSGDKSSSSSSSKSGSSKQNQWFGGVFSGWSQGSVGSHSSGISLPSMGDKNPTSPTQIAKTANILTEYSPIMTVSNPLYTSDIIVAQFCEEIMAIVSCMKGSDQSESIKNHIYSDVYNILRDYSAQFQSQPHTTHKSTSKPSTAPFATHSPNIVVTKDTVKHIIPIIHLLLYHNNVTLNLLFIEFLSFFMQNSIDNHNKAFSVGKIAHSTIYELYPPPILNDSSQPIFFRSFQSTNPDVGTSLTPHNTTPQLYENTVLFNENHLKYMILQHYIYNPTLNNSKNNLNTNYLFLYTSLSSFYDIFAHIILTLIFSRCMSSHSFVPVFDTTITAKDGENINTKTTANGVSLVKNDNFLANVSIYEQLGYDLMLDMFHASVLHHNDIKCPGSNEFFEFSVENAIISSENRVHAAGFHVEFTLLVIKQLYHYIGLVNSAQKTDKNMPQDQVLISQYYEIVYKLLTILAKIMAFIQEFNAICSSATSSSPNKPHPMSQSSAANRLHKRSSSTHSTSSSPIVMSHIIDVAQQNALFLLIYNFFEETFILSTITHTTAPIISTNTTTTNITGISTKYTTLTITHNDPRCSYPGVALFTITLTLLSQCLSNFTFFNHQSNAFVNKYVTKLIKIAFNILSTPVFAPQSAPSDPHARRLHVDHNDLSINSRVHYNTSLLTDILDIKKHTLFLIYQIIHTFQRRLVSGVKIVNSDANISSNNVSVESPEQKSEEKDKNQKTIERQQSALLMPIITCLQHTTDLIVLFQPIEANNGPDVDTSANTIIDYTSLPSIIIDVISDIKTVVYKSILLLNFNHLHADTSLNLNNIYLDKISHPPLVQSEEKKIISVHDVSSIDTLLNANIIKRLYNIIFIDMFSHHNNKKILTTDGSSSPPTPHFSNQASAAILNTLSALIQPERFAHLLNISIFSVETLLLLQKNGYLLTNSSSITNQSVSLKNNTARDASKKHHLSIFSSLDYIVSTVTNTIPLKKIQLYQRLSSITNYNSDNINLTYFLTNYGDSNNIVPNFIYNNNLSLNYRILLGKTDACNTDSISDNSGTNAINSLITNDFERILANFDKFLLSSYSSRNSSQLDNHTVPQLPPNNSEAHVQLITTIGTHYFFNVLQFFSSCQKTYASNNSIPDISIANYKRYHKSQQFLGQQNTLSALSHQLLAFVYNSNKNSSNNIIAQNIKNSSFLSQKHRDLTFMYTNGLILNNDAALASFLSHNTIISGNTNSAALFDPKLDVLNAVSINNITLFIKYLFFIKNNNLFNSIDTNPSSSSSLSSSPSSSSLDPRLNNAHSIVPNVFLKMINIYQKYNNPSTTLNDFSCFGHFSGTNTNTNGILLHNILSFMHYYLIYDYTTIYYQNISEYSDLALSSNETGNLALELSNNYTSIFYILVNIMPVTYNYHFIAQNLLLLINIIYIKTNQKLQFFKQSGDTVKYDINYNFGLLLSNVMMILTTNIHRITQNLIKFNEFRPIALNMTEFSLDNENNTEDTSFEIGEVSSSTRLLLSLIPSNGNIFDSVDVPTILMNYKYPPRPTTVFDIYYQFTTLSTLFHLVFTLLSTFYNNLQHQNTSIPAQFFNISSKIPKYENICPFFPPNQLLAVMISIYSYVTTYSTKKYILFKDKNACVDPNTPTVIQNTVIYTIYDIFSIFYHKIHIHGINREMIEIKTNHKILNTPTITQAGRDAESTLKITHSKPNYFNYIEHILTECEMVGILSSSLSLLVQKIYDVTTFFKQTPCVDIPHNATKLKKSYFYALLLPIIHQYILLIIHYNNTNIVINNNTLFFSQNGTFMLKNTLFCVYSPQKSPQHGNTPDRIHHNKNNNNTHNNTKQIGLYILNMMITIMTVVYPTELAQMLTQSTQFSSNLDNVTESFQKYLKLANNMTINSEFISKPSLLYSTLIFQNNINIFNAISQNTVMHTTKFNQHDYKTHIFPVLSLFLQYITVITINYTLPTIDSTSLPVPTSSSHTMNHHIVLTHHYTALPPFILAEPTKQVQPLHHTMELLLLALYHKLNKIYITHNNLHRSLYHITSYHNFITLHSNLSFKQDNPRQVSIYIPPSTHQLPYNTLFINLQVIYNNFTSYTSSLTRNFSTTSQISEHFEQKKRNTPGKTVDLKLLFIKTLKNKNILSYLTQHYPQQLLLFNYFYINSLHLIDLYQKVNQSNNTTHIDKNVIILELKQAISHYKHNYIQLYIQNITSLPSITTITPNITLLSKKQLYLSASQTSASQANSEVYPFPIIMSHEARYWTNNQHLHQSEGFVKSSIFSNFSQLNQKLVIFNKRFTDVTQYIYNGTNSISNHEVTTEFHELLSNITANSTQTEECAIFYLIFYILTHNFYNVLEKPTLRELLIDLSQNIIQFVTMAQIWLTQSPSCSAQTINPARPLYASQHEQTSLRNIPQSALNINFIVAFHLTEYHILMIKTQYQCIMYILCSLLLPKPVAEADNDVSRHWARVNKVVNISTHNTNNNVLYEYYTNTAHINQKQNDFNHKNGQASQYSNKNIGKTSENDSYTLYNSVKYNSGSVMSANTFNTVTKTIHNAASFLLPTPLNNGVNQSLLHLSTCIPLSLPSTAVASFESKLPPTLSPQDADIDQNSQALFSKGLHPSHFTLHIIPDNYTYAVAQQNKTMLPLFANMLNYCLEYYHSVFTSISNIIEYPTPTNPFIGKLTLYHPKVVELLNVIPAAMDFLPLFVDVLEHNLSSTEDVDFIFELQVLLNNIMNFPPSPTASNKPLQPNNGKTPQQQSFKKLIYSVLTTAEDGLKAIMWSKNDYLSHMHELLQVRKLFKRCVINSKASRLLSNTDRIHLIAEPSTSHQDRKLSNLSKFRNYQQQYEDLNNLLIYGPHSDFGSSKKANKYTKYHDFLLYTTNNTLYLDLSTLLSPNLEAVPTKTLFSDSIIPTFVKSYQPPAILSNTAPTLQNPSDAQIYHKSEDEIDEKSKLGAQSTHFATIQSSMTQYLSYLSPNGTMTSKHASHASNNQLFPTSTSSLGTASLHVAQNTTLSLLLSIRTIKKSHALSLVESSQELKFDINEDMNLENPITHQDPHFDQVLPPYIALITANVKTSITQCSNRTRQVYLILTEILHKIYHILLQNTQSRANSLIDGYVASLYSVFITHKIDDKNNLKSIERLLLNIISYIMYIPSENSASGVSSTERTVSSDDGLSRIKRTTSRDKNVTGQKHDVKRHHFPNCSDWIILPTNILQCTAITDANDTITSLLHKTNVSAVMNKSIHQKDATANLTNKKQYVTQNMIYFQYRLIQFLFFLLSCHGELITFISSSSHKETTTSQQSPTRVVSTTLFKASVSSYYNDIVNGSDNYTDDPFDIGSSHSLTIPPAVHNIIIISTLFPFVFVYLKSLLHCFVQQNLHVVAHLQQNSFLLSLFSKLPQRYLPSIPYSSHTEYIHDLISKYAISPTLLLSLYLKHQYKSLGHEEGRGNTVISHRHSASNVQCDDTFIYSDNYALFHNMLPFSLMLQHVYNNNNFISVQPYHPINHDISNQFANNINFGEELAPAITIFTNKADTLHYGIKKLVISKSTPLLFKEHQFNGVSPILLHSPCIFGHNFSTLNLFRPSWSFTNISPNLTPYHQSIASLYNVNQHYISHTDYLSRSIQQGLISQTSPINLEFAAFNDYYSQYLAMLLQDMSGFGNYFDLFATISSNTAKNIINTDDNLEHFAELQAKYNTICYQLGDNIANILDILINSIFNRIGDNLSISLSIDAVLVLNSVSFIQNNNVLLYYMYNYYLPTINNSHDSSSTGVYKALEIKYRSVYNFNNILVYQITTSLSTQCVTEFTKGQIHTDITTKELLFLLNTMVSLCDYKHVHYYLISLLLINPITVTSSPHLHPTILLSMNTNIVHYIYTTSYHVLKLILIMGCQNDDGVFFVNNIYMILYNIMHTSQTLIHADIVQSIHHIIPPTIQQKDRDIIITNLIKLSSRQQAPQQQPLQNIVTALLQDLYNIVLYYTKMQSFRSLTPPSEFPVEVITEGNGEDFAIFNDHSSSEDDFEGCDDDGTDQTNLANKGQLSPPIDHKSVHSDSSPIFLTQSPLYLALLTQIYCNLSHYFISLQSSCSHQVPNATSLSVPASVSHVISQNDYIAKITTLVNVVSSLPDGCKIHFSVPVLAGILNSIQVALHQLDHLNSLNHVAIFPSQHIKHLLSIVYQYFTNAPISYARKDTVAIYYTQTNIITYTTLLLSTIKYYSDNDNKTQLIVQYIQHIILPLIIKYMVHNNAHCSINDPHSTLPRDQCFAMLITLTQTLKKVDSSIVLNNILTQADKDKLTNIVNAVNQ